MCSLFDSVLHSLKGLPVLLGTSQGNAYPDALSTVEHSDLGVSWDKSHNSPISQTAQPATQPLQTPWIDELRQLNTDTDQRGKSWTLPVNPGQEATIPIWTSRDGWMRQVRYAITKTAAGRAAAARHRIGVESMVAIAGAHASSADSKTGRRVTATVQNLAARAGVSESVVKRGRRVLKALHLGVELVRGRTLTTREFQAAEVHHGGRQHRAASVWALSSPPDLVAAATPATPQQKKRGSSHRRTHRGAKQVRHTATRGSNPNPQARDRDPLSLSGFSPKGISCREVITKRAGTRENRPSSSNQTNPRPMNLQRAASVLVAAAPVIAPSGHIGAVCDVIERSGIDTTRWTGRDIAQALTADTVSRGELWPNVVRSPIGYLTWRLSRIDWSGLSLSEQRAAEATRSTQLRAERDAERERARRAAASPERRKVFMEQIRATLAPQRQAA
ncbi:replication protein [Rhodococcus opacus]|uniref:replication protein n=1 Tax=Rhodococcus opacus TaxID=37919 RepID=UPI001F31C096|nr:replication protein [Rhodococcus opacus]